MNILQITNSLQIGGAERFLSDFIPQLQNRHHVELLVLQSQDSFLEKNLKSCGIKIHYLNVKSIYNPITLFKLRKFLKENSYYDIIHVHLFPSLYWVAMATKGLEKKLVWTEHSTSNRRRGKWYLQPFEKYIYSAYDKIVCISQATLESITSWIHAQQDELRFCVIENGVNIERFRRISTKKAYEHTLIQVSRFEASKDQETVIRAMQYLNNDVHLLLVGDGSRLISCKALCRELKVQDRVHFLGMRKDINLLLSSADIAIQSSHWEGFGLTAVEAMANGLPVIASDVNGLKQVVENAGILFKHGDDKALADIITSLLTDPELYDVVSKRCLQHAKMYSIDKMIDKYNNIYEELSLV